MIPAHPHADGTVTVRVPGKINLGLSVGPPREDGYHDLATVFHAVSLVDHVTVQPAQEWSVHVTGPWADRVPAGEDNIALVAARALHDAVRDGSLEGLDACDADEGPGPVRIDIDKRIPVAGGMAGGSADAAGALVGCRELWGLDHVDLDDLSGIAAGIGSDVPFLLHGGTAIGTGRGEQITPVLARGELHWVLWAGEGLSLSTPAVYAECDRLREEQGADVPPPAPPEELMQALRRMDTTEVAAAMHNDLQEAAISLQPVLAEVIGTGLELGAVAGLVSGSGPTVAFLVGTHAEAIDLSVGLAANGPTGDIVRAVGPVPGAQVISGRAPRHTGPEPTDPTDGPGPGPIGPVTG